MAAVKLVSACSAALERDVVMKEGFMWCVICLRKILCECGFSDCLQVKQRHSKIRSGFNMLFLFVLSLFNIYFAISVNT